MTPYILEEREIRMRSCVCMLLPNNLSWVRLGKSLPLLKKNLISQYPVDFVVFHETGFSELNKSKIRSEISGAIFREISFNIHESARDFQPLWSKDWSREKCLSYGGMCTFYTKDIFEEMTQMGYDYYMRLDDDSYLHSTFDENPFEFLQREGKIYGYCLKIKEAPHVIQGLFDFILKHSEVASGYHFDPPYWIYYNNFEIVDVKKYREKTSDINMKLHESGGIYFWRWGDAPIRTILLSIYFSPTEVHEFDISYEHAEHSRQKA